MPSLDELWIAQAQQERWQQVLEQEAQKQRREGFVPKEQNILPEKAEETTDGALVVSCLVLGWGRVSMTIPNGQWGFLDEQQG